MPDEICPPSQQLLYHLRAGLDEAAGRRDGHGARHQALTVGRSLLDLVERLVHLLAKADQVLTETRVSLQLAEAERLSHREAVEQQRATIAELRAQLAVVEGERDDALLTINELTAPAAVPIRRGPYGVGPYLLTDKARAALGKG